MTRALVTCALVMLLACAASASPPAGESGELPDAGPALSADASWVRHLAAGIGLLFVAAAGVGPLVRAGMASQPPAPHDQPHAGSHR